MTLLLAACGGDDEGDRKASTAPRTATGEATSPEAPAGEVETQSTVPEEFAGGAAETETEARADRPSTPATGGRARRTCLRGSWVSTSFKGRRGFESPFGQIELSGRGSGLGLGFAGRRWTFRGVGEKPMRGRALGIKGTLKVNGSARGWLAAARGGSVRFRQTGTRGTVTLGGFGAEFELPVSVVAAAIVPDGPAKVRCGGGRLVIDSRSGVLRMRSS
ncbi:MAG: hypothetical protein JXB32_10500 [Deltaproteobacteria bacterium]|nr:hypothetical protein [Deltaproteobacteria bacterium]